MKVKQQSSDFLVEEVIDIDFNPDGEYTYFLLTKENWTTMRAVSIIAKMCNVSHKRFKFAGTKDRIAITKQVVSAWNIEADTLEKIRLKDIDIEILGKGDSPISLGTLKGNKFEIIIRDLPEKIKVKERCELIKKQGFVNYFGEQRFGRGNTHLIGKEILKGNLEQAVKELLTFKGDRESEESKEARDFAAKNWRDWKAILAKLPRQLGIEKAVLNHLIKESNDFAGALRNVPKSIRKMYIHAYQSFIFNHALKKVSSAFRRNALTVRAEVAAHVELPGYKTKLGDDTYSKTVEKLLKKDGIKLEDFACKRMPELSSKGLTRQVIVKPKDFKIGKLEEDELNKGKNKIKIKFELVKGAYATILIDQIFTGL